MTGRPIPSPGACGCGAEGAERLERSTLRWLLAINGAMFLLEAGLGLWGRSTGLIADGLDMLADAAVYALSLLAVGRGTARQRRAARLSGWLQVGLAALVMLDGVRRYALGSEPMGVLMASVAALALAANLQCLALLQRHRDGGLHMRASLIFSTNDTIANAGVIVAGLLVTLLGSPLPDLLIGLVISLLVLRGGIRILRQSADGADGGLSSRSRGG
ncbi:cation efflux protein [Cyanobium sp. PCC 7001]|uniref:cation transporter n=1 Tax=Cyanobium sp. PCC 7001 TaxID=180281 RepID=UPI00018057E5|nr:cation transporter [Cyanobium sp. PCC 7001]EDY39680.1 cation efflux protein [Cyanobium sp. PCC 7001]